MGEKNFNVVALRDGYFIDFERRFTHIENIAKPVFDKIIETETVSNLEPIDIASVCFFFVVQHLRSKASRQSLSQIPHQIRERFPDIKTNDLPEHFTDEEYDKFCLLKFATENIDEIAKSLITKRMILLKKECSGEIYISDNPLVMHNYNDYSPYGNIGLGAPGIEIYHPISSKFVIGLICESWVHRTQEEIRTAHASIDQLGRQAFLSGRAPLGENIANIEKARSDLERSNSYYSMLFEKQFAPISRDVLIFLNSLQLQWANRFIAARRQDFAFARSVMKERPQWRDHPRLEVA